MKEINRQLNEQEYLDYIDKWKQENKELIDSKKCRKVFLECLPKWCKGEGSGKPDTINWQKSINNKIHFIYNEIEGDIKIINYIKNRHSKLTIIYNDEISDIYIDNFKKCQIGIVLGEYTSEFKTEINTNFKDKKRDLTITDRKKDYKWKYYRYKCNRCGFDGGKHWDVKGSCFKEEYWILEGSLLHGTGCSCCNGKIVVEGINDIPTTAPWMVKYFQGGYEEAKLYTPCSNKNVIPVCPDCNRTKDKKIKINDIYRYNSINCTCKDGVSFPNKLLFNVLLQLNINFKTEYSPKWIKPKRYDFYFELNNKKYIIEMDGSFHNNYNNLNGQTAEESKIIDDYKDRLAQEHDIELIRVGCDYGNENKFEYIKQGIFNKLNKLFDLTIIDWNQCYEYSLCNLVKQACEYKKNNPNLTTREISKIMGYCSGTVLKWLKQGTEINLCQYNSKIEKSKSSSRVGKSCGKLVEIFKDNELLGRFSSIHELSRQSEKIFGVKLSTSKISNVCNNKRKTHKGFTFKYINDITSKEYINYDIVNKLKQLE